MSSSIEETFQPPEWATKEEVIKAAQHYINYWKIEAKHRNAQWLDTMAENARLKAEVERLKAETIKQIETAMPPIEDYIAKLEAQVERLTKAGDAMAELVEHMETVIDMDCGHKEVEAWNAAKEGKRP